MRPRRGWALGALALPLALSAGSGSTQIVRDSIDAGAGPSSSASFSLRASIGQPDAGAVMRGGDYALSGGFYSAAEGAPLPDAVFANGFEPTSP